MSEREDELKRLEALAAERHEKRRSEERAREEEEEERLRQAYLRRTGRKEMKP